MNFIEILYAQPVTVPQLISSDKQSLCYRNQMGEGT